MVSAGDLPGDLLTTTKRTQREIDKLIGRFDSNIGVGAVVGGVGGGGGSSQTGQFLPLTGGALGGSLAFNAVPIQLSRESIDISNDTMSTSNVIITGGGTLKWINNTRNAGQLLIIRGVPTQTITVHSSNITRDDSGTIIRSGNIELTGREDFVLDGNDSMWLYYDGSSNTWRNIGGVGSSSSSSDETINLIELNPGRSVFIDLNLVLPDDKNGYRINLTTNVLGRIRLQNVDSTSNTGRTIYLVISQDSTGGRKLGTLPSEIDNMSINQFNALLGSDVIPEGQTVIPNAGSETVFTLVNVGGRRWYVNSLSSGDIPDGAIPSNFRFEDIVSGSFIDGEEQIEDNTIPIDKLIQSDAVGRVLISNGPGNTPVWGGLNEVNDGLALSGVRLPSTVPDGQIPVSFTFTDVEGVDFKLLQMVELSLGNLSDVASATPTTGNLLLREADGWGYGKLTSDYIESGGIDVDNIQGSNDVGAFLVSREVVTSNGIVNRANWEIISLNDIRGNLNGSSITSSDEFDARTNDDTRIDLEHIKRGTPFGTDSTAVRYLRSINRGVPTWSEISADVGFGDVDGITLGDNIALGSVLQYNSVDGVGQWTDVHRLPHETLTGGSLGQMLTTDIVTTNGIRELLPTWKTVNLGDLNDVVSATPANNNLLLRTGSQWGYGKLSNDFINNGVIDVLKLSAPSISGAFLRIVPSVNFTTGITSFRATWRSIGINDLDDDLVGNRITSSTNLGGLRNDRTRIGLDHISRGVPSGRDTTGIRYLRSINRGVPTWSELSSTTAINNITEIDTSSSPALGSILRYQNVNNVGRWTDVHLLPVESLEGGAVNKILKMSIVIRDGINVLTPTWSDPSSTVNELNDLDHVSIPNNVTTNSVLTYNGTNWIPLLPAVYTLPEAISAPLVGYEPTKGRIENRFIALETATPTTGGGASELDDLDHVEIPDTVTTNSVLTWNGANWIPLLPATFTLPAFVTNPLTGYVDGSGTIQTRLHTLENAPDVVGGSTTLTGLTDTTISTGESIRTGHVLTWNGSNWINLAPPVYSLPTSVTGPLTDYLIASGNIQTRLNRLETATPVVGGSTTLTGLTDTTISTGESIRTGHVLTWSGSNWINLAPAVYTLPEIISAPLVGYDFGQGRIENRFIALETATPTTGGSSTLVGLTDTTIGSTVAENSILKYNDAGKWVPGRISGNELDTGVRKRIAISGLERGGTGTKYLRTVNGTAPTWEVLPTPIDTVARNAANANTTDLNTIRPRIVNLENRPQISTQTANTITSTALRSISNSSKITRLEGVSAPTLTTISGKLPLSKMNRGTNNYVLTGRGSGADPVWRAVPTSNNSQIQTNTNAIATNTSNISLNTTAINGVSSIATSASTRVSALDTRVVDLENSTGGGDLPAFNTFSDRGRVLQISQGDSRANRWAPRWIDVPGRTDNSTPVAYLQVRGQSTSFTGWILTIVRRDGVNRAEWAVAPTGGGSTTDPQTATNTSAIASNATAISGVSAIAVSASQRVSALDTRVGSLENAGGGGGGTVSFDLARAINKLAPSKITGGSSGTRYLRSVSGGSPTWVTLPTSSSGTDPQTATNTSAIATNTRAINGVSSIATSASTRVSALTTRVSTLEGSSSSGGVSRLSISIPNVPPGFIGPDGVLSDRVNRILAALRTSGLIS